MHRVSIGVDSVVPVRKQTRHHVARVAREGILMWIRAKLPVHASCLNWSRFGRSRQKANTASCVNSAMIEGMRYKVHLLLQGLVGAPSYGYGQSSPCMHRVWIGVDSGDPVRKQTRHHVARVAREGILMWILAIFFFDAAKAQSIQVRDDGQLRLQLRLQRELHRIRQ